MADKIDAVFKDYYSDKIQSKINFRIAEIKGNHTTDENIGGGRLKNVHRNSVEKVMIRIQQDRMIMYWEAQIKAVRGYVHTLDKDNQQMLAWHYAPGEKAKSWQQISRLMHLDQSTCKRRLDKIKKDLRKSMFNPCG
ncbi:RinA family protein [Convivina praedatoris]|uniref:RinA family protein n=1 Tax=Convivina praedatoris TaxID=2880963 RepID=UPI00200C4A94|nr:RinA family protein [Convivina sp. LMG 32447]CAH1857461.1 hypothetical protein R078138_01587 [Convivina sp. LMG 32447]